ncbi:MAG TPA: cytochrome c3 family protein [Opitutaceae bacterium]|nr:cytochrome c3 family protein [Opitutaceae bacterium]
MPNDPSPNPEQPPSGIPLFRPRATTVFRVVLLGIVLCIASTGYAVLQYYYSPYWNGIGYRRSQPVMFSHRHHAGELHIDCRYCHATVETSAFAGMPSTSTCLTCHSQIFTDTPMLRPVVLSSTRAEPLHWTRVTALPDHVYFNHSIHIAKGVGCTTCHGQVGDMPLMAKAEPMSMRWCISCHRDPAPNLRPASEIFAATWTPPSDQVERGRALERALHIDTTHLTNCSTCHH